MPVEGTLMDEKTALAGPPRVKALIRAADPPNVGPFARSSKGVFLLPLKSPEWHHRRQVVVAEAVTGALIGPVTTCLGKAALGVRIRITRRHPILRNVPA